MEARDKAPLVFPREYALKIHIKAHPKDLGRALAHRGSIEQGMNVLPAHARMGIEMPIERKREVSKRTASYIAAIQVDVGPAGGDFPSPRSVLDSLVGANAKEVLERIDPVQDAHLRVVCPFESGGR